MADEAKLGSPICSTFEALVVRRAVWRRGGEELDLSIDQCRLQTLQLSMHLINLLSILLRSNGFARIQKAVVGQRSNRSPMTMTFFVQVWLWEMLWSFFSVQLLSWLSLVST